MRRHASNVENHVTTALGPFIKISPYS